MPVPDLGPEFTGYTGPCSDCLVRRVTTRPRGSLRDASEKVVVCPSLPGFEAIVV